MPIQSAEIKGNSTEMMYYYSTFYVGDFEHMKTQALILDTGSGIMSFPC